ncbi:MAG: CHAD domain-containing protein [Pseudomonadota bacterium]
MLSLSSGAITDATASTRTNPVFMTHDLNKPQLVFAGSAAAGSAFARSYAVRALATGGFRREIVEEKITIGAGGVFSVERAREAIKLRKGGTRLIATVDQCVGDFGDERRATFAEISLTAKKGRRSALYDVARLCLEESAGALTPVSPDPAVRAARFTDRARLLAPANKISVRPDQTVGAVYHGGIAFCARRALALAPLLQERPAGEPLRQMRVLLRRLRTYERIFRAAAPNKDLSRLSRRARGFARLLGEARDWDVFFTQTLPSVAATGETPGGMAALQAAARQHQLAAAARIAELNASPDFSLFLLDLARMADAPSKRVFKKAETPVAAFATDALEARLAAAREAGAGLALKDLAAGHPLRLALKKLRYSAQLFRDLYDRDARKPYFQALASLQQGFGALNDAAVAQALATRAASGEGKAAMRAAGFVSGYQTARAHAASARILEDWRAFSSMTPYWA